jgi:hypothetical protein
MKRSVLFFTALLCALTTHAQTIQIGTLPQPLCVEAPLSITTTTTGSFGPDNTFKVQLRPSYGNLLLEYPATRSASAVTASIGLSSIPSRHLLNSTFQLRVVSTNPYVESSWSESVYLRAAPSATLGAGADGRRVDTLNRFDALTLPFELSGGGPYELVLTDSTRFSLGGSYDFDQTIQHVIYPARSATYQIQSVRNACGLGQSRWQRDVVVNPISLRALSMTPATVCQGSFLYISYSSTGGNFGTDNRFSVRLRPEGSSSGAQPLDLLATLENNTLRVTMPAAFALPDQGAHYSIQLVASSPRVVSNTIRVRIVPAATAELVSPSTTVSLGDWAYARVRLTGTGPFAVELSDGIRIRSESLSGGEFGTNLYPSQTTTYAIRSFSSGCSSSSIRATAMRVDVRPGVLIDSLGRGPFCEGQTLRARIRSNRPITADTRFFVELDQNGTLLTIQATYDAGLLTFTLPTLQLPAHHSRYFSARIAQQNATETGRSAYFYPSIHAKPTLALAPQSATAFTLEKNGDMISPFFELTGGGPYTLRMQDGSVWPLGSWGNSIPVHQPGTFVFESVSNECGTSPASGRLVVTTRTATPSIGMTEFRPPACSGDSLQVRYHSSDAFQAGNEVRLQVRINYGVWQDVAQTTGRSGWLSARLPTAGSYDCRLASTNPVAYSETRSFSVRGAAAAVLRVLSDYSNRDLALLPGDTRRLEINVQNSEGPFQYVLTDGRNDFIRTATGSYAQETVAPTVSSTYSLKSVRTACGPATTSGVVRLPVVPLRIQLTLPTTDGFYQTTPVVQFCGGGVLPLNYAVEGATSATTVYSLQWASATDTVFADRISNSRLNPFVYSIPSSLAPGLYLVRVVAKEPQAVSNTLQVRILAPPTAILTAPDGGTTTTVPAGSSMGDLRLTLTGTPSWQLLLNNGQSFTASGSPTTWSFPVSQLRNYQLLQVTNGCGYGTVSGTVSVRMQPWVILRTVATGTVACAGQSIVLQYEARGDFDAGNRLRFSLISNDGRYARQLDSTEVQNGQRSLRLPPDLPGSGTYRIQVQSTNPVTTSSLFVQASAPPALRLLGTSTILAGQSATLQLTGTRGTTGARISYQLSDGTRGEFDDYSIPFRLTVRPTQTTTYTVTSISNNCGAGTASGSATVTVTPASDRVVQIAEAFNNSRFCGGDTLSVPFTAQGTFSAGNRFTVQVSDSTGSTFQNLTTVNAQSPLRAFLPLTLPRGSGYRIRVSASDAGTASTTNAFPLTLRQKATARFDTSLTAFEPGSRPGLVIRFTGDAPWYYSLQTDLASLNFASFRSPDTLRISQVSPSAFYRLSNLTNGCGPGQVLAPSTIKVELLTATPESVNASVRVFPNPTSDVLRVQFGQERGYRLRLYDSSGRLLSEQIGQAEAAEVPLRAHPPGVYLLHLELGTQRATYKVIRQ